MFEYVIRDDEIERAGRDVREMLAVADEVRVARAGIVLVDLFRREDVGIRDVRRGGQRHRIRQCTNFEAVAAQEVCMAAATSFRVAHGA